LALEKRIYKMTPKTRLRLLVCGGRHFSDAAMLYKVLNELHDKTPVWLVINGGSPGADTLARDWSVSRDIAAQTFFANWREEGAAAGPNRNARMLAEGRPNFVVAFPGGKGTANMIAQAMHAGVDGTRIDSSGRRHGIWSSDEVDVRGSR
jgi:hypothetical protein